MEDVPTRVGRCLVFVLSAKFRGFVCQQCGWNRPTGSTEQIQEKFDQHDCEEFARKKQKIAKNQRVL